ncbi:ABC transporter substrate-binding protein [Bacillus salacetis]|uniref:ABC transporter substrate-binding protein n=1 Tax=Bacillus salacetis TaxID=2315464 RepID=A0A3A1QNH0_9BACI|nr:ABC transporter substrate-binding protein [Bacillus salacetis]RIW28615.1 ABC transporter substrate-binding protein [Bacillus salacetis]
MKRLTMLLLGLMLAAMVITGCGNGNGVNENSTNENQESTGEQQESSAFPVTITDAADKEIVIEEEPERIVSLIPSNTEIAYELGLGDKVVGVSDFDNYPPEAAEKEMIGGLELNIEKIISLEPDLVLAHGSVIESSAEGLQQLRDAGLKVMVVNDAKSFAEVYTSIEMIGKASGADEQAEETIQEMKDGLRTVNERTAEAAEKKSVFVEVSPSPEIFTAGSNTFMDEMLELINAKNAAEQQEGWVQMNEEAVVALNPDVIITTYGYYTENAKELVLSREGWGEVPAIQNERVYDVHSDLVTRTGPRLVQGVEELAKAVYPELFQ